MTEKETEEQNMVNRIALIIGDTKRPNFLKIAAIRLIVKEKDLPTW